MQTHTDTNPEARLVVRRGIAETVIGSDPLLRTLHAAEFTGRAPRTNVHGSTVELRYPRFSVKRRHPRTDAVILNGSMPWRIEVDGGVGEVSADLSAVELRSLSVDGGVARSSFTLPRPTGSVAVTMGAVSHVTISRPEGVPVRVHVRRGSRDLRVDDQGFGAVGGPATIVSPGFEDAEDRIDITVDAATALMVTSRPTPSTGLRRSVSQAA